MNEYEAMWRNVKTFPHDETPWTKNEHPMVKTIGCFLYHFEEIVRNDLGGFLHSGRNPPF